MRNTGLLVILVGVFIVINAGSFRDVVLGKAKFNFINPKTASTTSTSTTPSSSPSTNPSTPSSNVSPRGGASFTGGASGSF